MVAAAGAAAVAAEEGAGSAPEAEDSHAAACPFAVAPSQAEVCPFVAGPFRAEAHGLVCDRAEDCGRQDLHHELREGRRGYGPEAFDRREFRRVLRDLDCRVGSVADDPLHARISEVADSITATLTGIMESRIIGRGTARGFRTPASGLVGLRGGGLIGAAGRRISFTCTSSPTL